MDVAVVGVAVIAVVFLTHFRSIKCLISEQAPVTLEWKDPQGTYT